MRAMQLVSGSKLKRAQNKLAQFREPAIFLDALLLRLLSSGASPEHALCRKSEEAKSAVVLFTSDAGLCGAYNLNLIQFAQSYLDRDSLKQTRIIFIGKKGHRYFTKRGFVAYDSFLELAGRPNIKRAEEIGKKLMADFLSGELSSVNLIYSKFISATSSKPMLEPWLPVQISRQQRAGSRQELQYIFEPSAKEIFNDLLPRWALSKFQNALLEAFTSEHSARMIAMKNATDNAEELLSSLTLQRNKLRQANITKELSEIVGTVEALK
jgi:F-type H+-transporting ATPase subunit gamma